MNVELLSTFSCTCCGRDMAMPSCLPVHMTGVCFRCTDEPGWQHDPARVGTSAAVVRMLAVPDPTAGTRAADNALSDRVLNDLLFERLALIGGTEDTPRTIRDHALRALAANALLLEAIDREASRG